MQARGGVPCSLVVLAEKEWDREGSGVEGFVKGKGGWRSTRFQRRKLEKMGGRREIERVRFYKGREEIGFQRPEHGRTEA